MSAEAALIASMLLFTTKSTVKVFPTFVVTDDGEILKLAAKANWEDKIVIALVITQANKKRRKQLSDF